MKSGEVTVIGLNDPLRWSAALSGIPHSFAHTWDCCSAIQSTSGYPTYLVSIEDGPSRAVCPISEREYEGTTDITTPFGFGGFVSNGPCPNFVARWREFCQGRGYVCGYFALHPLFTCGDLHGPTHASNMLFLLDLRLGTDGLLKNMSRERRRIIRRWKEKQHPPLTDRQRLTEFLLANHGAFMRSVGASAASTLSDRTLQMLCSSVQVDLIGIEEAGEIVAVHGIGYTAWSADALFFLALPDARNYLTPLSWEAVERSIAMGLPSLNLGGGLRPDDSIALAKKLIGAAPHPLRRVKDIYDPERYKRLCHAVGVDPEKTSEYFPPYHRPGAGTRAVSS
jgi:hypothetical protein